MSETDSTNQANQSQPTPQPQAAVPQFLSNFNDTIPSTPRSATAAGILGIFLGAFGAHNWYLGQKRRGLLHCVIFCAGLIVITIFGVLAAVSVNLPVLSVLFLGLASIGWIAMAGNSIWGLIEGIIILSQGDPALAAKGYTVPAPVVYQQPVAPAATPAPQPTAATEEAKPAAKSSEKSDSKTIAKKSDK